MDKLSKILKRYFWLIGLIPIYLYYKNLLIYSQNIPHWDDYALINFINNYQESDSYFEKIQLIFAQHNEHRIAFTRIISLLIYKVNGSLNFQWMIWMGNFALLGILCIFYRFLKKNQISINYLVPICFFLFQLSLYENSYWGMASVQNFWVVFFVLMAFWQISNHKIPYFWAFIAAFTSANGVLFIPLIGVMIFLFERNYQALIKFSFFSLILVLIYFLPYQQPPNSQPITIDIFNNAKAALMNFGSVLDFNPNRLLELRITQTSLFGGLILLFFGGGIIYKYLNVIQIKNTNHFNLYFLAAILLFGFGTCCLTSISRLQYGFYVFLTSKYKIYSIMGMSSLYLLLIINFQYIGKRLFLFIFSILSIYLFIFSYYYSIGPIKDYYKSEIADYYNGWHNGKEKVETNPNSCFQYSSTFLDWHINELSVKNKFLLGKVEVRSNSVFIQNQEFITSGIESGNGAYLEFTSATNRYIFAAKQEINNNKKAYFLKNQSIYGKGFTAEIPLTEIVSGNYFINILDKSDHSIHRIATNYYIEIEGIKAPEIKQNW
ncbi:MAG: hypothetical protein V4683_09690 [Bacteroidota bacterium]